jgi:hypothetical protein
MKHTGFRAIFVAGFLLYFCCHAVAQTDGYLSSLSVTQGEKLRFYISTPNPIFDLKIYKLGLEKKEILVIQSLPGGIQHSSDSAFIHGCDWKATEELVIPLSWESGVYEADIPSADTVKKLIFIVREKEPGKHSKTVVCLTANTWQAYNNWGGRSLYDFNSYSQTASLKVSFDRPFSDTATAYYFRWADILIKWLEEHHFEVEFCVNADLDNDPLFLSHYKVYVTVGHDEYWSKPERNALETFLHFGGKLICLSGNTCWWQVRFEDNQRTMVCYRDTVKDPMYPAQDSIVTSVWGRSPINDPPNSFLGVSFEHGGFINDDGVFPKFLGYGGYTIFNSHHWIYNGTGVKDGDVIGKEEAIAGYESDGALFDWDRGFPVVTGEDKTPENFSILGISLAASAGNLPSGHATMGYYTTPNGGAVFNGGSTDWVCGLEKDDSIQSQMLFNVFWRFTSFFDLPPEISSFSPVRVTRDSINHEWVNVNHMSRRIGPLTTDTFMIHSKYRSGEKPLYNWIIAGKNVSFDSVCILTPETKKKYPAYFMLEGTASIGFDKASVDWALLDTAIRFVSVPGTNQYKRHANYFYHAIAASLADEHPKYTMIYGPSWLRLDASGNLRGIIGDLSGDQTVILRATDLMGNYDYQTYTIHISDSLARIEDISSTMPTVQCFPNPITDISHFLITLYDDARVEIEITDDKGMHMRSLYLGSLTKGRHIVDWNRNDDSGGNITSGIYLCRFHIVTSDVNRSIMIKVAVM